MTFLTSGKLSSGNSLTSKIDQFGVAVYVVKTYMYVMVVIKIANDFFFFKYFSHNVLIFKSSVSMRRILSQFMYNPFANVFTVNLLPDIRQFSSLYQ